MTDFPGKKFFKFGRKTTNFLTIVAGAIAGSGICYGFFSNRSLQATRAEVETYHTTESSQVVPAQWISAELPKKYAVAVHKCRELVERFKNETGSPGVVVGVSINGDIIWKEGFGYSNLETGTRCHAGTSMRIASISKPITMTLLAKMWEDGKIDLDKPVQNYLHSFPTKEVDGEKVDITSRQLASHTSGIRHYSKKGEVRKNDSQLKEFYIKEKYVNVEKSLDLFKNDELLFKPGTSFEYTTHGYTLLSAVMEKVGNRPFKDLIQDFFKVFGMHNTFLDDVNAIIYNRSNFPNDDACIFDPAKPRKVISVFAHAIREYLKKENYYSKNNKGRLINAELADTSYKWAGGGIISTVEDLLKFGNAMLYSYQQTESDKSGYLKSDTVKEMWTPVKNSTMTWGKDAGYGLGWIVVPYKNDIGGIDTQEFYVGHGGGAVGASSILLIIPRNNPESKIPNGIAVAILTNMQDVSCHKIAKKIAEQFS